MKLLSFQIEFITPCLCGGAEPEQKAEVRAPSIRGQLRWWFRVLEGFRCLNDLDVRMQENQIFGTVGENSKASKLIARVNTSTIKSENDINANTDPIIKNYILFPLRKEKRGVIDKDQSFELQIDWRGTEKPFKNKEELKENIKALISIWVHLGGLGFRSRRGFGALAGKKDELFELKNALSYFNKPKNIEIYYYIPQPPLPFLFKNAQEALKKICEWYKSWRTHGLISGQSEPPNNPGFHYARRDHNEGLEVLGENINNDPYQPLGVKGETFRAALGLPIIQYFRKTKETVSWYPFKDKTGRFASPILLRPYKHDTNQYYGLVIFVEIFKWNSSQDVYLIAGGEKVPKKVSVSLDLYNAMKKDQKLTPFLPFL
ncbi:type III-B CRISPR module RAMP protein Cmr1 [Methylacidiphilum caldifontis]|uniref:Type III-B CRISPR module RAMP protein Cmr1 n=1 Tax=Methylacidiphilum caldifontis TaxID=2795386 RepID=A0A4Y8P6R5_9BACT|nr:type III-B CRISPR module RAMP protein Cmr1 [Methylacidiphilum caldifontis]TFE65866.1 type III-B CRISPR module RAMP protein Cmr1 [Methylacidiphilum caldifontis]